MSKGFNDYVDLGHGHAYKFFVWDPDLKLNPQYAIFAHMIRRQIAVGASIKHPRPDGQGQCNAAVHFDCELTRTEPFKRLWANNLWKLNTWDPLDIAPSVLCRLCNDHGFVRKGLWVPA